MPPGFGEVHNYLIECTRRGAARRHRNIGFTLTQHLTRSDETRVWRFRGGTPLRVLCMPLVHIEYLTSDGM